MYCVFNKLTFCIPVTSKDDHEERLHLKTVFLS